MLRLNLQNAHQIMAITREKLLKYSKIFRKHIPGDSLHEVHQAMDGVEELCELLKVKETAPYGMPAPVERAFEANEAAASASKSPKQQQVAEEPTPKVVRIPSGSLPPLMLYETSPRHAPITDAQSRKEFVKTLQMEKSIEAAVKHESSSPTTPENSNENSRKSNYEIPDTGITRTAAKIIGNRKELEMHEFFSSKRNSECEEHPDEGHANSLPNTDPPGDRDPSPNDD